MPELPEVETIKQGLIPFVQNHCVRDIKVRQWNLRWPISKDIFNLIDQPIQALERRGKYLLFVSTKGTLLMHLGMSGRVKILSAEAAPGKHDHVDILFEKSGFGKSGPEKKGPKKKGFEEKDFKEKGPKEKSLKKGHILRFTDPRRFGCLLWTEEVIEAHPLLKTLGPEPLEKFFNADYFFAKAKNKKTPIKSFIMDSHVVVGVGNIYANEALFLAGVHPLCSTHTLSYEEIKRLVKGIKRVLTQAIAQGGTTLKDFSNSHGSPGYFQQKLKVYGRAGHACMKCKTPLEETRLAQRSSVFCPECQPGLFN